jgi:hypothetical protein
MYRCFGQSSPRMRQQKCPAIYHGCVAQSPAVRFIHVVRNACCVTPITIVNALVL